MGGPVKRDFWERDGRKYSLELDTTDNSLSFTKNGQELTGSGRSENWRALLLRVLELAGLEGTVMVAWIGGEDPLVVQAYGQWEVSFLREIEREILNSRPSRQPGTIEEERKLYLRYLALAFPGEADSVRRTGHYSLCRCMKYSRRPNRLIPCDCYYGGNGKVGAPHPDAYVARGLVAAIEAFTYLPRGRGYYRFRPQVETGRDLVERWVPGEELSFEPEAEP